MAIIVATIEDGATESDIVACGGGLITAFSADSAFDGAAITLKYNGTNPVKDEEGTVRSIAIAASDFIQVDPPIRCPLIEITSDTAQVGADSEIEVHTI